MRKSEKHILAIEILHNQIKSLKHEQESMFMVKEHKQVNELQDEIDRITSSIVALNELSVSKPLRNIQKLRKQVEKRNEKREREKDKDSTQVISFDTMWHDNQSCAIVPLEIMKYLELEI